MNKLSILFLSAASAFIFFSCVKEENMGTGVYIDGSLGNPRVLFSNPGTKCAESHGDTFLGESTIVTEDGDTLYVSAYLSDMENCQADICDDTKSTLVGSDNFGKIAGYESFSLNVYKDGDTTIYYSEDKSKTKASMGNVPVSYNPSTSEWSFDKTYYWPTDGKPLNFCSFGPSSEFASDGSVSNIAWNKDTRTFSFKYTTPSASADTCDAQNQKDIIVGVNNQAYSRTAASNDVVLSLTHPLMAVRFVLGDIYGQIEYLSLENFYSEGVLSVTADTLVWSDLAEKKRFAQIFDMFDATKYTDEQKASGTIALDQTTGKTRNFIIIPQIVPDDAKMGIKVGKSVHQIDLSFKKMFKDGLSSDWRGFAGKVLTFRVSSRKANLVSVDITDDVNGMVKNNIKIFNDGKSDLYVRAVLVGNWLNVKGNVLAAWDESVPYGLFDGGSPLTSDQVFPNKLPENWILNKKDGFYYYRQILPPGYRITNNLFEKFELTDQPEVENSEDPLVQIAMFEMSILVQAVAAVDPEGGSDVKYSARTAWGIPDSLLLTTKDYGTKMK